MSQTFTPAVQRLYALACSPVFADMTPDDLTSALREVTHWVDDAARELIATFDQEPDWNFMFLDLCKSIVARRVALHREGEFLSQQYGNQGAINVPIYSDETVLSFFEAYPRTLVLHFYMFKSGQVILAAASNIRSSGKPVAYFVFDVIGHDEATSFLELLKDYAKSIQTDNAPDFDIQSRILQMLGKRIFLSLMRFPSPANLFIIPHRLLHILPLHSLFVDGRRGRIYLDNVCENISYVPSVHSFSPLLQYCRDDPSAPKKPKMLAVADEHAGLKWIRTELENFRILKEKGVPLDLVTKTHQLPHDMRSYCYISWSAHAKSDPISWGGSWIELHDARVTAKEVAASWRLRKGSVVTLAACETGVDLSVGLDSDEYCGLDMAFCLAGAGSVFSTMWPVSDPTAALLSWAIGACFLQGDDVVKMIIGLQQDLRRGRWHKWLLSDKQIERLPDKVRDATQRLHNEFRSLPEGALMHEREWSVLRHYRTL